jgi:Condensation domain/Phosphopantetheine attachment site
MATTAAALTSLLAELFPHSPVEVTLNNNLIQLGGDSIIAAAIAAHIHRLWSVNVSVKYILQLENFAVLTACLPAQTVEREPQQQSISTQEVYHQTDEQKMVYLETFRQPGTTAYNIPIIAELPTALSPQVLQNAIQKTVKCFPAIFTRFYDAEGEFLFRYHGEETITVIRYDTLQQAEEQFVQPFDLEKDCLLRAAIVPFDGCLTRIMLDFSHIIADGLSIGHFIHQLKAALYQKPIVETEHTLFDYSRWTETADYQAKFANAEKFWRRCLQPGIPKPHWPGIRHSPPTQSGPGYAMRQVQIDASLAADIRLKAEQHHVTTFTLFLLGWYLLQSNVTDTWNSRIGLVVSGRTEPEYYDTFGMFVNTLLLPVNFSGETSLQHALASLASETSAALEHQHYPFVRQIHLVQQQHEPEPPLDALFAFQNIEYQKIELFGGYFRSFHQAKKMAQFGMVIQVFDLAEQGYDIQWEYMPEIFSASMVSSFLSQYQATMKNIANSETHHNLQQLLVVETAHKSVQIDLNVAEFNFGI